MDLQSAFGTANQVLKNAFKGISDEMQMCIQNCTLCHQVCEQTLSYCLTKGGAHVESVHLKELIDCSQICTVSADFMSRGSRIHPSVCSACADACMACALSCETFGNDETMKLCADVCRRCAESCQKMAGQRH